MNSKKGSLGVVICVVIIVLLLIVIAGMYFFVLRKNDVKTGNEVSNNPIQLLNNNENVVFEKSTQDEKDNVKDEIGDGLEQTQANTVYSLFKNYKEDTFKKMDKYLSKTICIGDSTKYVVTESNYNQYDSNKNELKPYNEKINIKAGIFNTAVYEQNIQYLSKDLKEQYKLINNDYYFELTGLTVMNGNNTSEELYKENSRAKKIKVTVNNKKEYVFELEDTNKIQLFNLDYIQNIIETFVNINIEVLEIYKGTEKMYM